MNECYDAIQEVTKLNVASTVYYQNGITSKLIYSSKNKKDRPIYYTRPDGMKVRTLSIHPFNYPMVAVFADGSKSLIKL